MNKKLLLGILGLALLPCLSRAQQSTTIAQASAGPNCHTYGCINTPLSDGAHDLLTWANTSREQAFTFRGLTYLATAKQVINPDGSLTVELSSTAFENNGLGVNTDFAHNPRGGYGWKSGVFILDANANYVGSGTYLYGWNGSVDVTSGTGQVGLVTNTSFDQTVTLLSSNPNILQVPVSVVIPAGAYDTNFTITATAPQAPPLGAPTPVTVTATFPDNTVATMTVTVGTIPASSPSDSTDSDIVASLYRCGIKRVPCKL